MLKRSVHMSRIKPTLSAILLPAHPFFLSFSIYCLALAFEHYRQVYIVHSGLQDESLQVTYRNYRRVLYPASFVHKFYFSESRDAIVLQTCH